jgi:dihydroflavonol-4-reductase
MKALITGANGHIGCHLVRACIETGITPLAMVRAGSDRRSLAGLDVAVCEGDVMDAAAVERAVQGVDWVFHCAAVHRNFCLDDAEILGPGVTGTRNVLAAARRAGVKRVVHCSTGATVGYARDPSQPIDETAPTPTAKSTYVRAKLEAEKLALAANGGGLEVVVVNPSGVFGPRDYKLTPATRGIVGLLQGNPSMFALCFSDVRDVAMGHVLAAKHGRPGERYLLTGELLTSAQVASTFREVTGVRPLDFTPPRFLLRWAAAAEELKARRTGQDAGVTRDQIDDFFGLALAYDASKARSELGATFRPARDVVRDATRWLMFVDALKPRVTAKLRGVLGSAAAPDPDWVR